MIYVRGVWNLRRKRNRHNVIGALRRRNWTQARIWMGWSKPRGSK